MLKLRSQTSNHHAKDLKRYFDIYRLDQVKCNLVGKDIPFFFAIME